MASYGETHVLRLTYTPAVFDTNLFYLDQLLNQRATLFALTGKVPQHQIMGALATLPMEILITILEQLLIHDLLRFRRCNRFACRIVDTKPLLGSILEHAPNVVKGLVATKVNLRLTPRQLREKLCNRYCESCTEEPQLAQFIYIPTCSRVCYSCIQPSGWYSSLLGVPFSVADANVEFGFGPEDLTTLHSFQSLPVILTNGLNRFEWKSAHTFYDSITVSTMYRTKIKPSRVPMDDDDVAARYFDLQDYYTAMNLPDVGRESLTMVQDAPPDEVRLHMSVVYAPWVDSTFSEIEHGVFCSTCLYTEDQDLMYDKTLFLKHLEECRVKPYDSVQMSLRQTPSRLYLVLT